MKFKLKRASDYLVVIREVEINSMEKLKDLPERYEIGIWNPPHKIVINFEEKEIIIYDDYLE